jgi:tetratricopeptide (TPR) repeat protein
MEVLPAARTAALRAIALDESIAEAHTSLAHVLYQFEWDFPGAEKEFRRAIALSPNDPNAHQWYSNFLSVSRRNEESFEQIRLARRLDPLNLITYADAGLAYYLAGQYDRAIEELRQSLELEANFHLTHLDLGLALAGKGLFEQAIDEAKIAMRLEPNDPNPISLYGYACARAGRLPEVDQALESLRVLSQKRFVSSFLFGFLYAGLGKKEKILEWLEKAYEERAGLLVYLNVERAFDPLRSEPRFQDLVRRMKLPA